MKAKTWQMPQFLRRLVDIRPEERLKTMIMSFYFFAIIMTVWMLKPVRNSLFLDELGAENLRYVYMGEGVFLIGVVWAFIQFSKKVSRKVLYNGVLLFFIGCLAVFWLLFRYKMPFLSAFFYIWGSSYSIVMTTQFFILANDIFNPLEAKRLFGVILSAGSIGGVLGGILTSQLAHWVGTENLLLFIAGIIGLCNFLIMTFWKHLSKTADDAPSGEESKNPPAPKQHLSGRKLLMGSSYLLLLLGLIMLAKIGSTVVDNQFNGAVELAIAGKDARTAFYGSFFSLINALSFAMQFFMTSIILRYLGVGIALWILPAGLLLGGFSSFIYPVLFTSGILKAFDGSVNYSIQQASREVLYLPIATDVRYRVKPVIDMLGFRIAKSFGGLYIAVLAPLFKVPDEKLGLLILFLIPVWFFVAWKMRLSYSKRLQASLMAAEKNVKKKDKQRINDILAVSYDKQTIESIHKFFGHSSSVDRKLAAAAYSVYFRSGQNLESVKKQMDAFLKAEAFLDKAPSIDLSRNKEISELEEILIQKTKDGVAGIEDKEMPDDIFLKLGAVLKSAEYSFEAKKRVIKILGLITRQESADLLLSSLSNSQHHALRYVMMQALNELRKSPDKITISRFMVKNEVSRDAGIYLNLSRLKTFHQKRVRESHSPQDSLGTILDAMLEESFERIFCLLALIYPQKVIQIIHLRLVDHSRDVHIRSHAVELLHSTLDRDFYRLIEPLLDDPQKAAVTEEEVVAILKEFSGFHDQWFSFLLALVIEQFNLKNNQADMKMMLKNYHAVALDD